MSDTTAKAVFAISSAGEIQQQLASRAIAQSAYGKPVEVAAYGYDEQRNLSLDRSQLRIYAPTHDIVRFGDLSHGRASFVQKPADTSEREHLDGLLAAIKHCHNGAAAPNIKADLVTWRGIMTKILCTPYLQAKEPWVLHAVQHRGTIYLEEKKQPERMSKRQDMACYWGFKFESLCMVPWQQRHEPPASAASLDGPASKPEHPFEQRRQAIVNTNCEFGSVVKSKLGEHRLLLGAEIDGLDEKGLEYIELKTSLDTNSNAKTREQFENQKLMKYWAQSFLAGIPTILVGFRNYDGHLQRLEKIRTSDIPRRVRGRVFWDPQVMLAFGDHFLQWLRTAMMSEGVEEGAVYRLASPLSAPFTIELTRACDVATSFVPNWFDLDLRSAGHHPL